MLKEPTNSENDSPDSKGGFSLCTKESEELKSILKASPSTKSLPLK